MIDLRNLGDMRVAFKIKELPTVYTGVVRKVEESGLWIKASNLIGDLSRDQAWKHHVAGIATPVLFVPVNSLSYLIAPKERGQPVD